MSANFPTRAILARRLREIVTNLASQVDEIDCANPRPEIHELIEQSLKLAAYYQAVMRDLEHED